MDILISILAILAGIIGIAGSILPGLPGTPVSWIGLLILYIWGPEEMPLKTLIIWGIVVAIVSVIDYVVPMWFTKVPNTVRRRKKSLYSVHFSMAETMCLHADGTVRRPERAAISLSAETNGQLESATSGSTNARSVPTAV